MRGLYARKEYWAGLADDPAARHLCLARSLAIQHPTWTFCSYTAALLHGFPVGYHLLDEVHVVLPPSAHARSREGLVQHVSRHEIQHVEVSGVRVTPAIQAAADCMRAARLRDALPIADAALRAAGIPREAFVACVAVYARGRCGVDRALRCAHYADGLAESGGESVARAAMIEEGFQIPRLQVEFADPLNPGHAIRVDHLFTRHDGSLVAGELDGMGKYLDENLLEGRSTAEALVLERQRESHINALGIPVARYRYKDLQEPGRLAAVLDAFGVPRVSRRERSREIPAMSAQQVIDAFNAYRPILRCDIARYGARAA